MDGPTVRLGRWLFRWRGLTPLPVLAVVVALEVGWLRRAPAVPAATLPLALGLVLCLAGQALRFWIRGCVPEGSSSATRMMQASTLNTGGAYRFTRNPLYLANFLLCAGLLAQLDSPAAWLLGLAFFFGEYHFIIRSEEAFLLERFGEPYQRFLREVPRFWPRTAPAETGQSQRFDAARALRSEHNVAAAWLTGLLAVAGLRAWARAPSLAAVEPHLAGLATLGVVYLGVKGWKRGWWLRTAPSPE